MFDLGLGAPTAAQLRAIRDDFANKGDLRRGRTRRRILRWLKDRAARKLEQVQSLLAGRRSLRDADFGQALPHGVRLVHGGSDNCIYIRPVPNLGVVVDQVREAEDDLRAARGMLVAVAISIPIWAFIGYLIFIR